ncbi:VOC family protein [Nitriliruptoraceae bacterium ZYF776]|nr:VOC family protein [Profundirhabdus halotolerans]
MDHVSLVTIGVRDLDRATAYYEALGWRRSSASVDGAVAFLSGHGSVALSLFGRDALAAEAGVPPASGAGRSLALAVNLPSEAAVDAYVAAAVAAGGRVTSPPTRAEWGGYSGYLTDPDGHLWEVAHNPGFPLADDGTVTLPG